MTNQNAKKDTPMKRVSQVNKDIIKRMKSFDYRSFSLSFSKPRSSFSYGSDNFCLKHKMSRGVQSDFVQIFEPDHSDKEYYDSKKTHVSVSFAYDYLQEDSEGNRHQMKPTEDTVVTVSLVHYTFSPDCYHIGRPEKRKVFTFVEEFGFEEFKKFNKKFLDYIIKVDTKGGRDLMAVSLEQFFSLHKSMTDKEYGDNPEEVTANKIKKYESDLIDAKKDVASLTESTKKIETVRKNLIKNRKSFVTKIRTQEKYKNKSDNLKEKLDEMAKLKAEIQKIQKSLDDIDLQCFRRLVETEEGVYHYYNEKLDAEDFSEVISHPIPNRELNIPFCTNFRQEVDKRIEGEAKPIDEILSQKKNTIQRQENYAETCSLMIKELKKQK